MESWTGLGRRSCPSTLRVAERSRLRPGEAEWLTQLMAHTASPKSLPAPLPHGGIKCKAALERARIGVWALPLTPTGAWT